MKNKQESKYAVAMKQEGTHMKRSIRKQRILKKWKYDNRNENFNGRKVNLQKSNKKD